MRHVIRDGEFWPDPDEPPYRPVDWPEFRKALLQDLALNSAIAILRENGQHALSDTIVPAAMQGYEGLDQLIFSWNTVVAALSATSWQPPDYVQWQALADNCGIPIIFSPDGTIEKK